VSEVTRQNYGHGHFSDDLRYSNNGNSASGLASFERDYDDYWQT